ncbi:hypothetical protein C5C74_09480 [Rathayibacter sp. AY1E8]|uniref:hypothetical protein n=1 Tax=unclassified Rathayibacter TaxID=2609250 RepID=UPI000CE7FBFC|nr:MULTISPECIES: hypothetical protein [unclassified Rathayibacter]PPG17962.1 hypothetical protein C5C74_09480 [Rathayibacter sp. AY1E8]PPI01196.1 hypothetical protein C5C95_03405 [Rathayibacter sp. AY1B7]
MEVGEHSPRSSVEPTFVELLVSPEDGRRGAEDDSATGIALYFAILYSGADDAANIATTALNEVFDLRGADHRMPVSAWRQEIRAAARNASMASSTDADEQPDDPGVPFVEGYTMSADVRLMFRTALDDLNPPDRIEVLGYLDLDGGRFGSANLLGSSASALRRLLETTERSLSEGGDA